MPRGFAARWASVSVPLLEQLLLLLSHEVTSDSLRPWTAACQASLSLTISRSLLKLVSIESVMPSSPLLSREIRRHYWLGWTVACGMASGVQGLPAPQGPSRAEAGGGSWMSPAGPHLVTWWPGEST